jgi:hypothetical protein
MYRVALLTAFCVFMVGRPADTQSKIESPRPIPDLGIGADLRGSLPFAADSAWNKPLDNAPLRHDSDQLIANIGPSAGIHAEFGSGTYRGAKIGIPYVVIPEDERLVPINLSPYGESADLGSPAYRYPIPPDAPIEGYGTLDEYSDRHVIVVQRDLKSPNGLGKLYELFQAFPQGNYPRATTGWQAFGAIFDMTKGDLQRPDGWTSADAAGLPIFPGLVRFDEVARAVAEAGENGIIPHAFRFTLAPGYTAHLLVPPAQHVAGWGVGKAPFGMRVRLKASWQPTTGAKWPPELMVIVNTLKRFGMIMADNGGNWFITGAPDERWDNNKLHWLSYIKASDFEVVDSGPVKASRPK